MKIEVTMFGLDLFTLEVTTDDDNGTDPGDTAAEKHESGFALPEREGGAPPLVM
jgi:hypothetical protein